MMRDKSSFERFVVGDNSRFAYDLCVAVAEHPGEKYNPVFIYGEPGTGKTCLLKAIACEIGKKHPQLRVVYVSSETFIGEYIESLRNFCGMPVEQRSFWKKYREETDVLLIDDIQFLEGKESTQEEFYHVFNALYRQKKQIVLTSSKPRTELKVLGKALVSMFGTGVTAEISAPDEETCLDILRMKQGDFDYVFEEEVLLEIAKNHKGNVRELEGCMKKMILMKQLYGNYDAI